MKRITLIKIAFLVSLSLVCASKLPKLLNDANNQLNGTLTQSKTVSLSTLDVNGNKTVKFPIKKGRLCEYSFIELPSTIKADDRIDIRLNLGDGRDFVVVAGAPLIFFERIKSGTRSSVILRESEILAMASVQADLEIFPKARVYAVTGESGSTPSKITYPVNQNAYEEMIKISSKDDVTKDQYICVLNEKLEKERSGQY